jgi:hypothetical protein
VLPKHGVVIGVFLLAHAARLTPRHDRATWVKAASQRSTILAQATDLENPADALLGLSLAQVKGQVVLAPALQSLSYTASRSTLVEIARLLLTTVPPIWLWLAISNGAVLREYIPSADLDALTWLEPELDELLVGVHSELKRSRDERRIKEIGNAAEAMLLAAFSHAGLSPIHVAAYFDGYGYDIEVPGTTTNRIEVKAASDRTRGRFPITRNEYDKSKLYRSEWRLLQVIFTADAFHTDRIDASHVREIIQLSAEALWKVIPADHPGFFWTESAEVVPDPEAWTTTTIELDPNFSVAGLT